MLDLIDHRYLDFWRNDKTFKRSVDNRIGCPRFVIYEGPPTANGKPGIHHVLTRTFKDAIARFQTMRGKYVERKAGWDEHGLPVEIEIQKQLKLYTKKQIADYGIKKFNKHCAESTKKYIKDWEALTERMGYWLDFDNAYNTSDEKYIRKVWDVLRKFCEDNLIYKGEKVVPWACDSETVVSNAEAAQGYRKVKHLSAYVLFQLCDDMNCMLAWTTTPWTLPSNMALAVNPNLKYKKCRVDGRCFFSLEPFGEVIAEISGDKLVGQEYYHPFDDKVLPVLAADFVKEEKTGIVHIAPAFGEDDYKLWQEQLSYTPVVFHVDPDGTINSPDFIKGNNILENDFEDANKQVLNHLGELVFRLEDYEHDYPHNWRTGKPLIYYLRPSWYVDISKLRDKMIAANDKVTWYPDTKRFSDWVANGIDWSISRERFWGTPLPFFGDKVIYPLHFHKPEADESFGHLRRTPEVLDCWFDSGAMPFAAFDEYQRADVICEAVDQTRGWFYSLLAIGVAMKGQSPYKNVVCLGHVLDKNGNKMSKSKGNVVEPWKMFDKYGADSVRWYMASHKVGNSICLNEEEIKDTYKNFIDKLWNCFTFYKTYISGDKFNFDFLSIDYWLMARLQQTVNTCTDDYENYELSGVVSCCNKFVNDISNIWIRSNRQRFHDGDANAFAVLYNVLYTTSKIIAPIVPFFAEHLWKSLGEKDSVHLQDFPSVATILPSQEELLKEMPEAQTIISIGRQCRDDAKIKVRQPLNAVFSPVKFKFFDGLVKTELNVKNIIHEYDRVHLDTTLTEELLSEGFARDFIRFVQTMRQGKQFKVSDRINLTIDCDEQQKKFFNNHKQEIMKKLLVDEWIEGPANEFEMPSSKVKISFAKSK